MISPPKTEIRFGERLTPARHFCRSLLLSGPGLAWTLTFLLGPLLAIVAISFLSRGSNGELILPLTLENYRRFCGFGLLGFDPLYPLILARSLTLGLVTVLGCVLMGFPLAFLIAGLPSRYKTAALTLLVIPLWTNLLIRTYAWQILLARDGWMARLAEGLGWLKGAEALYPSLGAVWLGMVGDFLPFLVLPLYASAEKLDWALAEAAMDLGANPWQVFRHAILPQVMPGLAAGSVLVFVPATGQFVIPDLLGGAQTFLLGNAIQQEFGSGRDWPFGAAIAVVSMGLVLLGLWFYARTAGQKGEAALL